MIIDMRTILRAPRHFEFTLEPDWWQCRQKNDQILGFSAPLTVRIDISKAGNKYVLKGSLSGRLVIRCGRCLEPYDSDLESDFSLFLTYTQSAAGKNELELLEEDMSVDFIKDDEIDLDEVIRAQIYFSMPMKCLCRQECQGLCPMCGTNLNKEKCECRQESGHPGFSKLKNLLTL